MIRVLVINGQGLVGAGIGRILADEPDIDVVGAEPSGERALRIAIKQLPDVVVLDAHLFGMGSLEMARRLLRVDPDVRILGIGAYCAGPMVSRLLEVGVLGYLTKGCTKEQLAEAIRCIHRGDMELDAETAKELIRYTVTGDATPVDRLTPRELSVMRMLSEGKRRGEISVQLCISPKTVSTYRSRVMRKLGAKSDVDLAHLSLTYGLIEPHSPRCKPPSPPARDTINE